MFWELVIFSAVALLLKLSKVVFDYVLEYRNILKLGSNIPGPKPMFPIGMMWTFGDDPMLEHFIERYGDTDEGIARCQCLALPAFVVQNHEHLKTIFPHITHHASLRGDFFGQGVEVNTGRWLLGDSSILYTEFHQHDLWVKLMRLMSKPFLQINVQKQHSHVFKTLQRLGDFLRSEIGDMESTTIDVEPVTHAFMMDVLGRAAFSQNFRAIDSLEGGEQHKVLTAFKEYGKENGPRNALTMLLCPWTQARFMWVPTSSNRKMQHARAVLRDEVSRMMSERRKIIHEKPDAEFNDFLQHMLLAKDEETGFCLSDNELQDNLATIMYAGHDSTATNMTFMLYAVAKHPNVQQRIREEVDDVLANGNVKAGMHMQLSYSKCVVRETLRMFPSVPLNVRAVDKDVKLTEKYTIPKDSFIFLPIFAAMRSEHNWKNASSFIPERHMDNSAPFHSFMPFMHGKRNCIGLRFAQFELVLTLAYLCRYFEFSLPDDYKMEFEYKLPMLSPKHGVPLIIKQRSR